MKQTLTSMKKLTNIENHEERFEQSIMMCCMAMCCLLGMGGPPM